MGKEFCKISAQSLHFSLVWALCEYRLAFELRRFFGLPDLSPLNDELVSTLRERMHQGAEGYDPFSVLSASAPAMDTFQKLFWNAWSSAAPGSAQDSDDDSSQSS
mgnify:CR=1 FL=1